MNGQTIAEKDQTGAWTDYVFAGGKRIAMLQSARPAIHMHGMRDSTNDVRCGTIWYIDGQSAALNGYQIQNGDRLSYDLKQSTLNVLTALGFNNGTVAIGRGPVDGQWHHVTMDLSGSVGQVIGVVLMGPGDAYQGQGTWDAYEQNVVLTGADGSVHPLFTGGSASGYNPDGCGSHNLVFEVTKTPVDALNGTTFYVGDHLGSAQMEFSASGAPLSSSQFMPFGGEINPAVTANHYKFTGKERDAESGLDYFGFRYYGSNMGRWMSPDPSGLAFADPTNPQSLNLYSYVLNNPLSFVDPDGLECVWDDGSFDSADDKQTGSHGGCSAQGGTYVDPKAFSTLGAGDWSSQANSGIASVASTLSGDNNFTNVTVNANGSGYTDQTYMNMSNNVPYMLTNDSSHGPDPITQLATDVTADSNHMIGCIAQAYGVGGPGESARYMGQPVEGTKPFITPGTSRGSSPISEYARSLPRVKGNFRAPVGGPGTGTDLRLARTGSLNVAAARWAPFVGLALDAYAVAQLGSCLGH